MLNVDNSTEVVKNWWQ